MKAKVLLSIILLMAMVPCASAQYLIGSRATGMGGAAVAVCDDITAAYYNPAGLMRSGARVGELKLSLGAAPDGLNQLSMLSSSMADPAQFLIQNFNDTILVDGSFMGILGGQINKVGISLVPVGRLNLNKPAGLSASSTTGTIDYLAVLTLGHTFSVPFLPAALDVGANIKSINNYAAIANTNAVGAGTQTWGNGSGMGYDLGAVTSFDIPGVTNLAVGIVARDLSASRTDSAKQKTVAIDAAGNLVEGPEVDLGSTKINIDSSTAIGVSGKIPVIGLLLAADTVSGKKFSSTHFGLEYPLMAGLATLRAGIASGKMVSLINPGTSASLTTVGAKFNLFVIGVDVAYVIDSSDTKNNTVTLDLGGAF